MLQTTKDSNKLGEAAIHGTSSREELEVSCTDSSNKSGLVLDLAYEEYCLRTDRGEAINREEFCNRFGVHADDVRRLLLAHDLVKSDVHSLLDARALPQGNEAASRSDDWFRLSSSVRKAGSKDKKCDWPEAGQTVLGFKLIRKLGEGAFSRVYLASEDSLGDRMVTVKLSRTGYDEARVLGKLAHRNIVPIYSVQYDRSMRLAAICMPYMGCDTLATVLRRNGEPDARMDTGCEMPGAESPLTRDDTNISEGLISQLHPSNKNYIDLVIGIAAAVADSLSYVHSNGMVHNDLKPENVLLCQDGQPILLDFNLATNKDNRRAKTSGTLCYMSPEKLMSLLAEPATVRVDEKSDVFSLGLIIYELLAGVRPFRALSRGVSAREHASYLLERWRIGPPPLRSFDPRIHVGLATLVERCMAFQQESRPTAAELAMGLRGYDSARRWARRLIAIVPWNGCLAQPRTRRLVLRVLGWILSVALTVVGAVRTLDNRRPEVELMNRDLRPPRVTCALELAEVPIRPY